jgi:succinyl-CoA synthetase alpha subunit
LEANVSAANVKRARARGRKQRLAVMEACGIRTTKNPSELGKLLKSVLK